MPPRFYSRSKNHRGAWIKHYMSKGCSRRKAEAVVSRKSCPTYRLPKSVANSH